VTELEKRGTGVGPKRAGGRERRWPWLIGGLVFAAVKSEGLANLVFHRGSLIVVLTIGFAAAVLRVRPVTLAVTTALLLALVLGAHSLVRGLALGFAVFALLTALFFTLSAVLHARQNRSSG